MSRRDHTRTWKRLLGRSGQACRCAAMIRSTMASFQARMEKVHRWMRNRHGPGYTRVMLIVACGMLFVPVPGIAPVAVVLIALTAEIHRAVDRKRFSGSSVQPQPGANLNE